MGLGPLALLSPAKTLVESQLASQSVVLSHLRRLSQQQHASGNGHPLEDKTRVLLDHLGRLSKQDLKKLMKLNDSLAEVNFERFRRFSELEEVYGGLMYDGPAHKALDVASFEEGDVDYAKDCVITLSALYGAVRIFDLVRPYRLEMGCKLRTDNGKDLYEFWGDSIKDCIDQWAQEIKEEQAKFVVNLASQEYFKVIRPDLLNVPVVTIKFSLPSLLVKQARGFFCRFMVKRRVMRRADLLNFGEWSKQQSGNLSFELTAGDEESNVLEFTRITKSTNKAPPKRKASEPSKTSKEKRKK